MAEPAFFSQSQLIFDAMTIQSMTALNALDSHDQADFSHPHTWIPAFFKSISIPIVVPITQERPLKMATRATTELARTSMKSLPSLEVSHLLMSFNALAIP